MMGEFGGPVGEVVEGFGVGGIEVERSDGGIAGKNSGVVGIGVDAHFPIDALFAQPEIRTPVRIFALAQQSASDSFRLARELGAALPFFRDIDIEEDLVGKFFAEDELGGLTRKASGGNEIRIDTLGAKGHSESGDVVNHRFSGRADGTGIVEIFAEVGAVIDTGNDEIRFFREKFVQGDDDAVGGGAVDRPFGFGDFVADDGLAKGERLGGATALPTGSNDFNVGKFL